MGRKLLILGLITAAFPVSVDPPRSAGDSTSTAISVAAGGGGYGLVTRGCEGEILTAQRIQHRDAGASIDHRLSPQVHVGARAGLTREQSPVDRDNTYVNPYLTYDGRVGSLGAGYVWSEHEFTSREGEQSHLPVSAHLRLGTRRYFVLALMENVPLFSGGGYLDACLGFHQPRADVQLGVSVVGPYDNPGVLLKVSLPLSRSLLIDAKGRAGTVSNVTEWGTSLGLTWRGGHVYPAPRAAPAAVAPDSTVSDSGP